MCPVIGHSRHVLILLANVLIQLAIVLSISIQYPMHVPNLLYLYLQAILTNQYMNVQATDWYKFIVWLSRPYTRDHVARWK